MNIIRTPLATRIIWHTGPVLVALATLMALQYIDTTVFPVVSDFTVLKSYETPDGVVLEGVLTKKRNCEFIGINAYTNSVKLVGVRFMDEPKPGSVKPDTTRAVRIQMWGPWVIEDHNAATVSFTVRHKCHPVWNHVTDLGTFDLPSINRVMNSAPFAIPTPSTTEGEAK